MKTDELDRVDELGLEEPAAGALSAPQAGAFPILVVDDSRSSRALLKGLLEKWGHVVQVASGGEEAWEILQSNPVSFVITDWVMPGMAGPELCRRIRQASGRGYTYLIVVTSKSRSDEKVEALEAGADDFLSKPFDPAELRVRIRAGERVLALEQRLAGRNRLLARSHARLSRAHRRLEQDLQAAARVQESLLPRARRSVHGWRFGSLFLPSAYVSGDLFNYFSLDETRIGFHHLDVAGHGVPSALRSAILTHELSPQPALGGALKTSSPQPPGYRLTPPAELLDGLNQRHQDSSDEASYFTMVYGIVDSLSGACELAQGGHPSPIHLPRGGEPELIGTGGFPIGLLPEAEYENLQVKLAPGDRLVLHSDGVTDCRSPAGEPFGEERLLAAIDETRDEDLTVLTRTLDETLRSFRGSGRFEDDVSLLVLEAPGGGRNK